MLTLHGTNVTPLSDANGVVTLYADYLGRRGRIVTFDAADEDGYRTVSLETFDGHQVVGPDADLERFAAMLYMTAMDARTDYGTDDISDLWID